MNYVKFGKIVTSLRKEQSDFETGRPLSQKQLAQAANLPYQTIGKIERGELVNLRDDILTNLASALNLNTAERQEFWMASQEHEGNHDTSSEQAFHHIYQQFSQIKQPAFLLNPFYDLVAVNQPFLTLYGLEMRQLLENHSACNLAILLFKPDSPLRSRLGVHWYQTANLHLRFFRCISLRYRYTSYFNEIIKRLRGLPDFSALWQSHTQICDDFYSHIGELRHDHPVYGLLYYSVTLTDTRIPTGPLYLVTLIPNNTETFHCFTKLFRSDGSTCSKIEYRRKE